MAGPEPGVLARVGLWSALAFVFNLTWEIAHVRLYTIWATADAAGIAWSLLHCTLGDVAIALAMFALAGSALRRVDWPASRPWAGGAIVVIGAVTFTALSEWYNVYRVGSWGYAAGMPKVFGIGLSPLLQWLILPPAILAAYRALERWLFGAIRIIRENRVPDSENAPTPLRLEGGQGVGRSPG